MATKVKLLVPIKSVSGKVKDTDHVYLYHRADTGKSYMAYYNDREGDYKPSAVQSKATALFKSVNAAYGALKKDGSKASVLTALRSLYTSQGKKTKVLTTGGTVEANREYPTFDGWMRARIYFDTLRAIPAGTDKTVANLTLNASGGIDVVVKDAGGNEIV